LQLDVYVAARNAFGAEDNNDGLGRKQRLHSRFGIRLFGIRVDVDEQRQVGKQVVPVEFLLDFDQNEQRDDREIRLGHVRQ